MAFRTKKISQMDPKGSNLASTDLLEISELVSGSYVTKSITGAEIIASVPPTSVEWGDIGGVLSTQIDLQNALNGKQDDITLTTTGTSGASTFVANTLNVPTYSLSGLGGVPTTRTLTINGTTQDLSADRTFTISTGITIGTTAITSGTVGRVLFEGTGNVVQESANLFWDNTNGRLGIGLSSPAGKLDLFDSTNTFLYNRTSGVGANWQTSGVQSSIGTFTNHPFVLKTNDIDRMRIVNNGNVLINTNTDAGFKLDVNGTARVQTNLTIGASSGDNLLTLNPQASGNAIVINNGGFIKFGTTVYVRGASTTFSVIDAGFTSRMNLTWGGNTSFFNTTGNFVFGASTADASSMLQIDSTTRGFLPPRMTTTQKNAIASPASGLMVYDTTLNVISYYNGTMWI